MRSLEDTIRDLGSDGQLVHLETIPASAARFGARDVPMGISDLLAPITAGLWSHQVEAIEAVQAGQSVVVATGTASGKSRCYQIPIAQRFLESKGDSTTLALFPTKALAQDQLRALQDLSVAIDSIRSQPSEPKGRTRPTRSTASRFPTAGLVAAAYDGDTDRELRNWIRRNAHVVLSNPDMLHAGILPYHGRWERFLRRLQLVVIDELHIYRGIFGTHLAQILRRLQRVCHHYGSDPVFVFASATIGSPGELAEELCAKPVATVDSDGSPRGERLVAMWKPPTGADGVPVSPTLATSMLLAGLVSENRRSIAFCSSRRGAEVVAARAKRIAGDGLGDLITPYRGGLLASERRKIEAKLFDGTILGVAATSALELGMDIGGLDACICSGFPGTIASFRQQIGRVGRSGQRSLAILVAGDNALDQWYADHPTELFTRPSERVVINTANPFVLTPHVACAANEIPLIAEDADFWAQGTVAPEARLGTADVADTFDTAVRELVLADKLVLVNHRAVWAGGSNPAIGVSLRSSSGLGEFRIVGPDARLIGTVDGARAFSTVHEGAIYLHQGQQYRVSKLDLRELAAWVEPISVDEYTQARSTTEISFVEIRDQRTVGPFDLFVGTVEVTEQVVGYQRKRTSNGSVIQRVDLLLPPSTLTTTAFWYEVPEPLVVEAGLDDGDPMLLPGSLHAIEHCAIGMLPLFAICDRWDVGGVSTAAHLQTGAATIAIYDGYPGGAGVAELGFDASDRHLAATLDALIKCTCERGCPSCVQSPKCGNGNEPLDKLGATALLRAGLRR